MKPLTVARGCTELPSIYLKVSGFVKNLLSRRPLDRNLSTLKILKYRVGDLGVRNSHGKFQTRMNFIHSFHLTGKFMFSSCL